MIGRLTLAMTLFVAFTFGSTALAAEPDQSTVEQYAAELEEYRAAKGADAAKKDIEMVQKWIDESQVLLANGDDGAAKRRLKRVEFGLDLVRAILAAEQVRLAAEEQEAVAYNAPKTTEQLKAEIDKLIEQREQLQSELKKLQRQ